MMKKRRHSDLRHPRNPRRGPCQSPVYCPQGQDRRTSLIDISEMNFFVITPKSSLDLHPVNEGDKEVYKEARYPNQLVHRRFHPMGVHKVPSLVPSRVDKEGPRMVRVQVKPQEDFRVSSAVSDLSGRTVRFRVPKPSSREDPKAQESLQCHLGHAEGFQSRSGRADRVS